MNLRLFSPSRAAVSLLLLALMAVFTAQACGPEFFPDVFVLKLRPDHPKEFAAGKLGVLLPTYPRADLTVAFRYLNGGSLTPAEQKAYRPIYANDDPAIDQPTPDFDAENKKLWEPSESWSAARAKYATPEKTVQQQGALKEQQPDASSITWEYYLNCNADAFRTAVTTLNSRAKTWGEKSPDLADWLKGQDAVFSNCQGNKKVMPSEAPAGASALLKADRAYQIAAADFYAAKFDDARKAFEAIGQDSKSPWQGISRYLVARSLIRQAFLSAGGSDDLEPAKFDAALMQQAETLLQSLLGQNLPGISRHAIQNQLDLVRLRTEPTARLRELSAALSGPKTDPNYNQHLQDLTWYLNAQLDQKPVREDFEAGYDQQSQRIDFGKTYADLAQLRATSTLIDWLITYQSPAAEAKEHALAEWKSTHQLYWLLAAISKATEKDAAAPDLVAAAEQLSPDAPAWETFTYHRLRLLIGLGRAQQTRALLDQTMPQIQKGSRDSSMNAFLGLRMSASANLGEFLAYAPRKMLAHESESQAALDECHDVMKNPRRSYDCAKKVGPVQFSADAAAFFNAQAPLSTLIDTANSATLPEQLRRSVAMMAWVRAVLLDDSASAAKLFPLLPAKLQQQAGSATGFHALMTLLRNPGLRPYLDPGVQRSYSYDFVESYRDNWWNRNWTGSDYSPTGALRNPELASFLTPAQRAEAEHQFAQLIQQGSAERHLGHLALDYANAHPNDPDIAESLYLVLRIIRYSAGSYYGANSAESEAYNKEVDAIRKAAARLLRQRYAASPWTKKAAPFAG